MRIQGSYNNDTWYGEVTIDGNVLSPERSQAVVNHSPDGFSWGYAGSGPAQLALAILLAAGLPNREAVRLHQRFKQEFIQNLPKHVFVLNIDIDAWVKGQGQQ